MTRRKLLSFIEQLLTRKVLFIRSEKWGATVPNWLAGNISLAPSSFSPRPPLLSDNPDWDWESQIRDKLRYFARRLLKDWTNQKISPVLHLVVQIWKRECPRLRKKRCDSIGKSEKLRHAPISLFLLLLFLGLVKSLWVAWNNFLSHSWRWIIDGSNSTLVFLHCRSLNWTSNSRPFAFKRWSPQQTNFLRKMFWKGAQVFSRRSLEVNNKAQKCQHFFLCVARSSQDAMPSGLPRTIFPHFYVLLLGAMSFSPSKTARKTVAVHHFNSENK